jgi:hypothetical protein
MSDTKAEASYYEPCVEVICRCGNDFVYNTHYRDYGECDKCNRRYAYTCKLKEITSDTKAFYMIISFFSLQIDALKRLGRPRAR